MSKNNTYSKDEEDYITHDDMTVMRELLERVKGLSFVSSVPALELAEITDANEKDLV